MSFDAFRWAAKQRAPCSGAKLLLLALANYADKRGLAYPSTAAVEAFSEMDRKSVIENFKRLEGCGLIKDTGQRCGRTGQIKVWRLPLTTIPKTGLFKQPQKRNSSAFSMQESRERDTEPVKEPTDSKESASAAGDPIKDMFDLGIDLLTAKGVNEQRARSMIGHWRKANSDSDVIDGLIECRTQAISEPVEWLQKRFQRARYISCSGYQYRGTLEQVEREAEQRADWDTYWLVRVEIKRRAEPKAKI